MNFQCRLLIQNFIKPGSLVLVVSNMNSRFPISLFIHALIHCHGRTGLFVKNWSLWVGLLPIFWAMKHSWNNWRGKTITRSCPTVNSVHHTPPGLNQRFCVDEAQLHCNSCIAHLWLGSICLLREVRFITHLWSVHRAITDNSYPYMCLTVITHDATPKTFEVQEGAILRVTFAGCCCNATYTLRYLVFK